MSFSAAGLRQIDSRQNARVKELRAGLQHGVRSGRHRIAIEGGHLLEEAMRSGLRIRAVFVRSGDERLLPAGIPENAEVLRLSREVFASAVTTEHPQGIAAIVDAPEFEFEQLVRDTPLLVIAAGIQDPGNLGTLARSAEAFGATGIILLPGSVSIWNPKALRASSGSAFRLPVLAMTAPQALATLRERKVSIFAAVARGGETEVDFSGPVAILLGNEGAGLPQDWLSRSDRRVTIPYPGIVESLNAAVAGSVFLYEAARQRQFPAGGESSKVKKP